MQPDTDVSRSRQALTYVVLLVAVAALVATSSERTQIGSLLSLDVPLDGSIDLEVVLKTNAAAMSGDIERSQTVDVGEVTAYFPAGVPVEAAIQDPPQVDVLIEPIDDDGDALEPADALGGVGHPIPCARDVACTQRFRVTPRTRGSAPARTRARIDVRADLEYESQGSLASFVVAAVPDGAEMTLEADSPDAAAAASTTEEESDLFILNLRRPARVTFTRAPSVEQPAVALRSTSPRYGEDPPNWSIRAEPLGDGPAITAGAEEPVLDPFVGCDAASWCTRDYRLEDVGSEPLDDLVVWTSEGTAVDIGSARLPLLVDDGTLTARTSGSVVLESGAADPAVLHPRLWLATSRGAGDTTAAGAFTVRATGPPGSWVNVTVAFDSADATRRVSTGGPPMTLGGEIGWRTVQNREGEDRQLGGWAPARLTLEGDGPVTVEWEMQAAVRFDDGEAAVGGLRLEPGR